jgi:site-specific DNA-methyltransferase (adenine-specific)
MINEYLNKIYNVDCIEAMSQLPDQSVQMILTDIPYGEVTKNGAERAKYNGQLRNINKGAADTLTFDLDTFLEQCARVSNGGIYIFCGIEQVSKVYSYFDRHKDFMVRQCGWRKTNPSPANGQHMWLSSLENCVFAKRRKTKFNQSCKNAIWDFPVGRSKRHPTEKPLKLFEYLIESSSNIGDIVLDPCIGSGTTAEASLNLGRNYIGYEINKDYYNIANERINNLIINI